MIVSVATGVSATLIKAPPEGGPFLGLYRFGGLVPVPVPVPGLIQIKIKISAIQHLIVCVSY